jgi:hypothetical protein
MRFALPFLCLAAAACRASEAPGDEPQLPRDALANAIDELHVAKDPEDPQASPHRLGFLADAEVPAEYRTGRACRLQQNGRLALIAAAPGALARVDNRLIRLTAGGPIGPSGGYFEAPGVTISIGRRAAVEPGSPQANMAWPAGITVGGDPDRPLAKLSADWGCFTPAETQPPPAPAS